jgi:iron complex transport system ATP-binding protein
MLECRALGCHSLIRDLSSTFRKGEIHAILGPNGAGKSTFLKTVAGLLRPTQGAVLWNGQPLEHLTRKERSRLITFVPQSPTIAFDYTVEEFIQMGRYVHRTPGSVASYLHKVDCSHLVHRSMHHLSQGEKQRVYIARALATEAEVLLLDEPTASLDFSHQRQIWLLLKQLAHEGKTLLVANHDLHSSARICTHALVLQGGHCKGSGVYNAVVTPELVDEIFGVRWP